MSARIVFSEMTWSTCRSLIMSDFFRRFIAKNSPDLRFLASITLPKDPTHSNKTLVIAPCDIDSRFHFAVSTWRMYYSTEASDRTLYEMKAYLFQVSWTAHSRRGWLCVSVRGTTTPTPLILLVLFGIDCLLDLKDFRLFNYETLAHSNQLCLPACFISLLSHYPSAILSTWNN